MRHHILTAIGRLLFSVPIVMLFATDTPAQRFQAGLDFTTAIPQGEFKDNVDSNGFGIGGNFMVRLGSLPLSTGIEAAFATYGSETRQSPLSGPIPDIIVDVETKNNLVLTHFLLRAQYPRGRVRPYADGLIGFKYLFTETKVTADDASEPLATTRNLSDFAFSYGLGGGVQTRLAGSDGGRAILLDTKVRYLWGSRARYLREGSIERLDGQVLFEVLSSNTNTVTLQVGITFQF
jgi:hypothetical protein